LICSGILLAAGAVIVTAVFIDVARGAPEGRPKRLAIAK